MPEAPLLVWKDAERGEITLVNAAAFTADLLEMSRKSVYRQNSLIRYRVYNDTFGITIYTP